MLWSRLSTLLGGCSKAKPEAVAEPCSLPTAASGDEAYTVLRLRRLSGDSKKVLDVDRLPMETSGAGVMRFVFFVDEDGRTQSMAVEPVVSALHAVEADAAAEYLSQLQDPWRERRHVVVWRTESGRLRLHKDGRWAPGAPPQLIVPPSWRVPVRRTASVVISGQ
jgi:hypothetical protein